MAAPRNSFLLRTRENADFNQYWYSLHTISRMIDVIEQNGKRVAFLSTPSLYFSLKSQEIKEASRVFDYDRQWSKHAGYVFYDFKEPQQIPKDLGGQFDMVVIDPPFITRDVWELYAQAAKFLLAEGGKIFLSTVPENVPMMEELLGCGRVEHSMAGTLDFLAIGLLLSLSALFSGLTLGLMGLDILQLELIMSSGNQPEATYAKKIMPIREYGNFLLCTLLLGNVAVNALLSILMADLTSGTVGFLSSTILIVIFGEITPQALCSRHPLAVGAKTVWIVRVFMFLTFIVSWPISKALDFILGEEARATYTKGELKRLMEIHLEEKLIDAEEHKIVTGVLGLSSKTVADVTVPLEKVYMLEISRTLDRDLMAEIHSRGHSRIPVYDQIRPNIIGVLYMKDLILVDPDANTPLRAVVSESGRVVLNAASDMKLDLLLNEFKGGKEGHLAVIREPEAEGRKISFSRDPFQTSTRASRLVSNPAVGIATLEDVLEELIQDEIEDETSAANISKSYTLPTLANRGTGTLDDRSISHSATPVGR